MIRTVMISAACALLAGCTTAEDGNLPLVFGRTQNLGVNLSGSVPEQGGGLSLGFTDRNIAVVPTLDREGRPLLSRGGSAGNERPSKDALSVLGQFQASADQSGMKASLGTFFATGSAATLLAEGFSAQMGFGQTCEYGTDGKIKRCSPASSDASEDEEDEAGSPPDPAPSPSPAPSPDPIVPDGL